MEDCKHVTKSNQSNLVRVIALVSCDIRRKRILFSSKVVIEACEAMRLRQCVTDRHRIFQCISL